METRRLILAVATLVAAPLAVSASAAAATGLAMMPSTIMLAGMGLPGSCGLSPASGFSPAPLDGPRLAVAALSKSQAILGGQVSRLEAMARQQDIGATAGLAGAPALSSTTTPGTAATAGCQQLVLPSAAPFAVSPGTAQRALGADDFLASRRLPVKRTAFDAQWQRVSQSGVSRRLAAGVGRIDTGASSRDKLAAVNSWANANVRFVEDRVQYGQADYWASAQTTLRRRAGDCEDIAIAKMQLLAAMGVPRASMYLTIARDLARNADHALLIVRSETGAWVLDNATDELLKADQSHDFRPILSFSTTGKWLHGY